MLVQIVGKVNILGLYGSNIACVFSQVGKAFSLFASCALVVFLGADGCFNVLDVHVNGVKLVLRLGAHVCVHVGMLAINLQRVVNLLYGCVVCRLNLGQLGRYVNVSGMVGNCVADFG